MTDYDLAIIGWGAAGFAAAIKASELTSGQMHIALIGKGPVEINMASKPVKVPVQVSISFFPSTVFISW